MDVLLFHRRYRADWTAIDPGAEHTYEELAVEAGIARQPRSCTDLPVQRHDLCNPRVPIIAEAVGPAGRFRIAIARRPPGSTSEVRKRPVCADRSRNSHDYAHVVGSD